MSINIQRRSDQSYLFSGMNNKQGSTSLDSLTSLLTDYTSIKSGSYKKLMKAYYNKDTVDSTEKIWKDGKPYSAEDSKKYAALQTKTDALKEDADTLLKDSVFTQKDIVSKDENGVTSTVKGYDTGAIYQTVNSFAEHYNQVIRSAAGTTDSTVERRVEHMINQTANYRKALQEIGVSIKEDGSLLVDKEAFLKADQSKVKKLFHENGSYGYQISAQAALIHYAAEHATTRNSLYSATGTYRSNENNGYLFNTYF